MAGLLRDEEDRRRANLSRNESGIDNSNENENEEVFNSNTEEGDFSGFSA